MRESPSAPETWHAGEFALGTLVGRYWLLRRLGAGGMGVVYMAYDPELDRKVALKLLLPKPLEHPDAGRLRLLREAQALARLSHPNVVAIHDVGLHRGQVWVAMELVAGQTLGAWIRGRARAWPELLRVLLDAARGVAAAHAVGLVHRDLKPDNVMIGGDGRVRVMDFGLVHVRTFSATDDDPAVDPESSASASAPEPLRLAPVMRLTRTGAVQGTPAYMAPEQWLAQESEPATDQFGWSVMAWELLHGELPFAGTTAASLSASVLAGQRRPPPRGRRIPAWLRRVLERGTAREPARRWPTMDHLIAAIERGRRLARLRSIAVVAVVLLIPLTVLAIALKAEARRHDEYQAALARDTRILKQAFALPPGERGMIPYLVAELSLPHFEDVRKLLAGTDAVLLHRVDLNVLFVPPSFSADGTRMAANVGSSLTLWDLASPAASVSIPAPGLTVPVPLLSGDGSTIALLDMNGRLRLQETASQRVIHEFVGPDDEFHRVAPSFDGRRVLAIAKGELRLLAVDGTSRTLWRGNASPTAISISPDGQLLAAGFGDGAVRVWAADQNVPPLETNDGQGPISSVLFSPRGAALASISYDGTVQIRAVDLSPRAIIPSRRKPPGQFIFSPDERFALVLALGEESAQLWPLDGRTLPREFGGRGKPVAVDISPDSSLAAVMFDEGAVRVWRLGSHDDPLTFALPAKPRMSHFAGSSTLKFVAPRELLALPSDEQPTVWSLDLPGKAVTFAELHGITRARFTDDSRSVLSVTSTGGATLSRTDASARGLAVREWGDAVLTGIWTTEPDHVVIAFRSGEVALMRGDGSRVRVLGHCEEGIHQLVLSVDGRRLAAACANQSVLLWPSLDAAPHTLDAIAASRIDGGQLVLSDDGSVLATSGYDGHIRLWDADSGHNIGKVLESLVRATFQLSPDGTRLAVAAGSHIRVWRTYDDDSPQVLSDPAANGLSIEDFSADGRRIVTSSRDNIVRIWEIEEGRVSRSTVASNTVRSASFAPDGSYVLIHASRSAEIWHLDAARPRAIGPRLILEQVTGVAISPNGRRVAVALSDGTGAVYDPSSGASLFAWFPHESQITAVSFDPGVDRLLVAGDHTVRIHDIGDPRPRTVFGRGGLVRDAAVSARGRLAALVMSDGGLLVGDPRNRDEMRYLRASDTNALGAAICGAGDSAVVVAAFADYSVRAWELAAPPPEPRRLFAHDAYVRGLSCSEDGRRLVSASNDRTARSVDLYMDLPETVLSGHTDWVYTAAFASDGVRVVTASADGTASLWDVRGALPLPLVLSGHAASVTNAMFSPDGARVLTLSNDRTAKIWDATTGVLIRTLEQGAGLAAGTWSPDGRHLALASGSLVQVWEASGDPLPVFTDVHGAPVRSVEFSRDGGLLLSAADSGAPRAQLWDHRTMLRVIRAGLPVCLTAQERQALLLDTPDEAQRGWEACLAQDR